MRQDTNTERAVLGAMIVDGEARLLGLEALTVDDFIGKHRDVFEQLAAAERAGIPAGPSAFADFACRGLPNADLVRTFLRTAEFANEACSLATMRENMKLLRAASTARLAGRLTMEVQQKIETGQGGPELVDGLAEQIRALSTLDDEVVPLSPDLTPRTGLVGTGIYAIDSLLGGGIAGGEVMVIGARTSVGKSALALQAALAAMEVGTVVYWSMEMSREALGRRALSQMADVNSQTLQRGDYDLEEKIRIDAAWDKLRSGRLQYFWRGDLGGLRRAVLYRKPALVVVDYIQLIEAPPNRRNENRATEVGSVMRAMVAMAKQRSVPFIVVAQLNRANEIGNRMPRLSDLRESGDIEQDADAVLLLHREVSADTPEERAKTVAILAKNREGSTGTVRLHFREHVTKFVGMSGATPPEGWQ